MKVKKAIEVFVDIDDVISFFADPNNLINVLRATYNGKCYDRCKIINVESIEARSLCAADSLAKRYAASMSVRFVALVIVYEPEDILHGCKVVQVDQKGNIICSTKHAKLAISNKTPIMSVIKPGHIISLRVGHSIYPLLSDMISINATPFIGRGPAKYYEVIGDPCKITEAIAAAQAVIRKEMEKTDKVRKEQTKAWNQFNKLLYAYNAPHNPTCVPLEIILEKECPRWISRDARMDLSLAQVVVSDELPTDAVANIALSREQIAVTCFLDYAIWLKGIRKMCLIYNTPELIQSHTAMWAAMKAIKN